MNSPRWISLGPLFFGCFLVENQLGTVTASEEHFAKLETNRVHYIVYGSEKSPAVMLIHGWGGSTDIWRERLGALTNGAHLLVIDLPGHGASDKPKADYSLDYFATAVTAVLKDAHIERATLVGHSM